jgi:NO-binding membrane sensor protein with MHYT domain
MLRVVNCLADQHDWRLVLLAGLICFLASLGVISLFDRARAAVGRSRLLWTLTAGATTGCGIWATHFIAMLAYNPGYNTAYDIALTALSLLLAILVTTSGLVIAVYASASWAPVLGGAVVGGGIALMHYTGIWAMFLPGWITWQEDLVISSILLGMAFGSAALAVATRWEKTVGILSAASLLTLAIMSHHFTAISAVIIIPDPTRALGALALSSSELAVGVAAAASALVVTALVGTFADRR